MVKVRSYTALFLVPGTAQSTLHFTPGRLVHSNAISTSLGSIQPCYNYCTNYIPSTVRSQALIHTAQVN